MIQLKNTQRLIPIDTIALIADISTMLEALQYEEYDITVWLCGPNTIRRLNRDFKHKDAVTDILSFPHHPTLQAGKRINPSCDDDRALGDLIIHPARAARDAQKWNRSFDEHLRVLIAHGIAHLLGHDHEHDADFIRMNVVEKKLLQPLKLNHLIHRRFFE